MENTQVLYLIVFLVIIYFLFIHKTENFSGSTAEDPFSNLTCITDKSGIDHVFKIAPSLDTKNPHYTIHKLLHPTTKSPVQLSDFVDPGQVVKCNEAEFSAYFTKQIRNPDSVAGKLFQSIRKSTSKNDKSTWQTHECTTSNINDVNHWCGQIHNKISTDINTVCDSSIGKMPPKYCMSDSGPENTPFKQVVKYTTQTDTSAGPIANYLQSSGKPCDQQCLANKGALPQYYTDSDGKIICLKDMKAGGLSLQDRKTNPMPLPTQPNIVPDVKSCIGTPLFNLQGANIIDNHSKTNVRTAARPSIPAEKVYLNNWKAGYDNCFNSCKNGLLAYQ